MRSSEWQPSQERIPPPAAPRSNSQWPGPRKRTCVVSILISTENSVPSAPARTSRRASAISGLKRLV